MSLSKAIAASALALALVACGRSETNNETAQTNVVETAIAGTDLNSVQVTAGSDSNVAAAPEANVASGMPVPGTNTTEHIAHKSASSAASRSILEMSVPAAGSTVRAPVNELMLNFNPPAQLDEVTIMGPSVTMPMMITPVGEVRHYSLPLSALGRGSYTVSWRASAGGRQYRGSFGFSVR